VSDFGQFFNIFPLTPQPPQVLSASTIKILGLVWSERTADGVDAATTAALDQINVGKVRSVSISSIYPFPPQIVGRHAMESSS